MHLEIRRMHLRSRAATGAVALLLAFLPAQPEAAAAEDWIAPRSDQYELLVDQPEIIVPVPVKLTGVAVSDVVIDLIQVRHGKRADERLRQGFRPGKLATDPGRGPSLPVTVDLAKINRPGSYELLLEARNDDAEAVEFSLTVEYPQPALASVATHRVRRTLGFGGDAPEIEGLELRLTETTGKAWLTGLTLVPREFADESQAVVDVETLALGNPPRAVPPGQTVQTRLELKGDFPLGTTNGTAVVAADQLSTPVTVNFVIATRRSTWWIVWIILAGLLAGFLVRVVLQRQVELNEARLNGFQLVEKIGRALQDHPDTLFQSKLRPKLRELEVRLAATSALKAIFLSSARAEELTEAVTEADGALQSALTELETRRAVVQTRLADTDLVTKTRHLPGSIAAVLRAADSHVEAARTSLGEGKVGEADGQLDEALRHLRTELREPVRRWKHEIDLDDRLDPPRMPLPAYVTVGLTKAIAAFGPLLSAVPLPEQESSLAEVRSALGAVRTAHTYLSDLVGLNLRRWLDEACERTVAPMSALGAVLPDPQAVEGLRQAVDEFRRDLQTFDEENRPEAAIHILEDTETLRSRLDERWRQAVLKQNASQAVEDLVTERRYAEAAQQAAANLEQAATAENSVMVDRKEPAPPVGDAGSAPAWIPGVWRSVEPGGLEGWVRSEERPERVRVSRPGTLWQLAVAKGVRWLVAGLGLVIVGYLLFDETFVGTVDEMAGLFFWAFGLDVTVDLLWQQGKTLIPSS